MLSCDAQIRSPEFCPHGSQCVLLLRDYLYYVDVVPARGAETILWSLYIYHPYIVDATAAAQQRTGTRTDTIQELHRQSSPAEASDTPLQQQQQRQSTDAPTSTMADSQQPTHSTKQQHKPKKRTRRTKQSTDSQRPLNTKNDNDTDTNRSSTASRSGGGNMYSNTPTAPRVNPSPHNVLLRIFVEEPALIPPRFEYIARTDTHRHGYNYTASSALETHNVIESRREFGAWRKLNGMLRNRNQDGMRIVIRVSHDTYVDDIQFAGFESASGPLFRGLCPFGRAIKL
jgi:hypothetical protein